MGLHVYVELSLINFISSIVHTEIPQYFYEIFAFPSVYYACQYRRLPVVSS